MASYFVIAEEKLASVLKMKEKIQLNHAQSEYLCQILKRTVDSARSGLAENHDGFWRELIFAVERAEGLVGKCCNKNLLQAAISQTDFIQEFTTLNAFLRQCNVLLARRRQDPEGRLEESENRDSVLERIPEEESENTESDRKRFLQELEDLKRSLEKSVGRTDAERAKLAGFLLKRYKPPLTASGPTQSPDFTWKVESIGTETGRRLGTGGSGLTYDTTWLGEKFARKYFPGTGYRTFDKEAAVLIGLRHLNIVHTFCWSIDERSCSLIMELVVDDLNSFVQRRKELSIRKMAESYQDNDHKSFALEDRWSSHVDITTPFDLLEALHMMLQIATGMEYLEKEGVRHGDLKPSNILVNPVTVSEEGRVNVKLVDFGLTQTKMWSSKFSHQTQKEDNVRWKAPELFPSAEYDSDDEMVTGAPIDFSILKMADVYNFGLTCSHILTGEVPYSNLDLELANMRTLILSGERPTLPPPPTCPKRLEDLIQRCWGTSTKDRPNFSTICKELRLLQESAMTGIIS